MLDPLVSQPPITSIYSLLHSLCDVIVLHFPRAAAAPVVYSEGHDFGLDIGEVAVSIHLGEDMIIGEGCIGRF